MKTLYFNNTVTRRLSLGVCLVAMFLTTAVVQKDSAAQTTDSIWERLKVAGNRVNSSQITWLRTTTVAPSPSPLSEQDVQKIAASTRQEGEKHHDTEEQIQTLTKKFTAIARRHAQGYTKTNTMAFLHQGQTTRCDVFTQEKTYFAIDYYDGTNIVALIGFDKDPTSGVKPNQGTLVRGDKPLSYSAIRSGDLLFMVGQPVTEVFHPEDSKLQQNSDGSVTLEKPQKLQELDCVLRLHLSKEDLTPISMDYLRKGSSQPLFRWTVGHKKMYPGGVAFPEEFKFEAFNGAKQVTLTEDYTIVKVAFNKAADLTELRVPPGSVIDDMRFGQANIASYTLNTKGILPTDEKVKDLLLKQGRPVDSKTGKSDAAPANAEATQAAPDSLAASTYSEASLALGALMILGGCLLWRRSSPDKENKA